MNATLSSNQQSSWLLRQLRELAGEAEASDLPPALAQLVSRIEQRLGVGRETAPTARKAERPATR